MITSAFCADNLGILASHPPILLNRNVLNYVTFSEVCRSISVEINYRNSMILWPEVWWLPSRIDSKCRSWFDIRVWLSWCWPMLYSTCNTWLKQGKSWMPSHSFTSWLISLSRLHAAMSGQGPFTSIYSDLYDIWGPMTPSPLILGISRNYWGQWK